MIEFIEPNWPAPSKVKAYTTTRTGGFSHKPFTSLNLAYDIGDDPQTVAANRALVSQKLSLPVEPIWLKQVHGNKIVNADNIEDIKSLICDGAYSLTPGTVCVVTTADCLPLLLCSKNAMLVAALHVGWRGLAAGIIEEAIKQFPINASELLVWFGPAIGPRTFEVGREVVQQFTQALPEAEKAFQPVKQDKWLANIYLLAKQRLHQCGVTAIYGGDHCTYTEEERFFSYRRDKQTGRMASLIWLDN